MSAARVGWLDASSGASGDMLLGALLGAGVPLPVLQAAVDAVSPAPVLLSARQVRRNGFAATQCDVRAPADGTARNWDQIRALLRDAPLPAPVRALALGIFARLASAEAEAHGISPEDVHFHEVGALDAIADIVGAAAGFAHLGLAAIHCSPVALGGGSVASAHGALPVPAPAVAALLRGAPTVGGPISRELTTPTGAAVLATVVTGWGAQPAMRVAEIGVGAGSADPAGHANVLRLLVGESDDAAAPAPGALVIEANVDDLDPRLWPGALQALLDAGASDAWLTPILMKKGRPAHTLSVLTSPGAAPGVRAEIFRQTSTIGLREREFAKRALDREFAEVTVEGQPISIKLAFLDGALLNVQPEFEDVARAAAELDRPAKDVLAAAIAAASRLRADHGT